MPIAPIRSVGTAGIIKDTSPVLLPDNGWSDGRNVRFHNGSVEKIRGHESVLNLSVEPDVLLFWNRPTTQYWVYGDAENLYRVDSAGSESSIVASGDSFSADGIWHASVFNGGYTVVMNNTEDTPVYMQYGTAGNAQETTLTDLPDWPEDTKAGVLRPLGYALVAGNLVDESGSNDLFLPGSILISNQAAPGGIPTSWTVGEANLTTADEFELSQTSPIREIIDLRGQGLVFTEDSIHSITLATSPTTPTTVRDLNYNYGVLATGCAIILDNRVLAVDKNDVYITSGTGTIQSVIDDKNREYFFNNLHPTNYATSFIINNVPLDEAWICYPTKDNPDNYCDEALIWNYRDNTWTIRDLQNTKCAWLGPIAVDDEFEFSTHFLHFNGYASLTADGQQRATFSGTKSNSTVPATSAAFTWGLSGNANTVSSGVQEVQSIPMSGTLGEEIAGVADVQSFTLAGRSNVIDPALSEVVEFGIADNFDAGTANATADTLDFTFSATDITGSSTTSLFYAPSADDLDDSFQITGDDFTFTDTEELIDGLVDRYNNGTPFSGETIGTASKVGTDTFRITIADQLFFTLLSGDNTLSIGGNITLTNGSTSTVSVTSSVFSDTITTSQNTNILGWRASNSSFTDGDAAFSGVLNVATFSITNTSENIPAITGSFTSGADATQARTDIKTALSADTEFTGAFSFTEDTDIAAIDGVLDFTLSTTSATVDFQLEGGEVYAFRPNNVGDSVFITGPATDTQIDSIEDLVDSFVSTYNADTSSDKIGVATKVGTDTFRLTVTGDNLFLFERAGISNVTTLAGAGSSIPLTVVVSSPNFSETVTGSTTAGNGDDPFLAPVITTLASFMNGRQIGRAARYTAITAGAFEEFMFDIIENGGSNTTPILFVSTQGADQVNPSTMYTLTDGSNTQSVTFSSSVTVATDNDRSSILSTIETAVDTNTETPINYTAAVSGDVVTLTAAEVGASIGNWTLMINNQGAPADDLGTLTAVHANDTAGVSPVYEIETVTFTDPITSFNYVINVGGDALYTAAEVRSAFAFGISSLLIGWDVAVDQTEAELVFTNDVVGPVTTLWSTSTPTYITVGVTVIDTAGAGPVAATTVSMISSSNTQIFNITLGSGDDTDTIGAFIANATAVGVSISYDSATNVLTSTNLATGEDTRPVVMIVNDDGTFAMDPTGSNSSGSERDATPSIYTVSFPTGFTPTSMDINVIDRNRSQTLTDIRDQINNIVFTPGTITASVEGSNLTIQWEGVSTEDLFAVTVDNGDGDGGGDITVATAVNENPDNAESAFLMAADRTNTFNGFAFEAYIERKNLDMGDLEAVKWVSDVYPLMTGTGSVTVRFDGTDVAGTLIDFNDTEKYTFNIAEDYQVSKRSNGRFFNVRFESDDTGYWKLDGYSVNAELSDRR